MVDSQLLRRTIFKDIVSSAEPEYIPIKFHLQRGKIARVLGFSIFFSEDITATITDVVTVWFRKSQSGVFEFDAKDILWGHTLTIGSPQYTLPKPYRCSGMGIQTIAMSQWTGNIWITIYYDVDDMQKGEDVQVIESTKQKGRRVL